MKQLVLIDPMCAQTDPDVCFPKSDAVGRAKALCRVCSAENNHACRDFAIANDERHGVWGGLTVEELAKLKDERARNEATYQNSQGA